MIEVLTEAIALPNLPFTVLLGGVVAYWILVGIGLLQFDHGGGDLHHDFSHDLSHDLSADGHLAVEHGADGHFDGDALSDGPGGSDGAHAHGDGDGDGAEAGAREHSHGLFSHALHFVNAGQVPAMIVLSVWMLGLWFLSMLANHYFGHGSLGWALALVVPNLLISAVATRYLTWPLAKFFGALNREYEEHQKLIGRTCVVATSEVNENFGQARIDRRGSPLLINVRASDSTPLRKGETGLVVREDKTKNVYYVVKVTPETERT
jgi:hypothetical protein